MADWNAWKEKALNLTRTGVSKAKVLGEIARLNLDNLSEEEKIKKAYIEIGERYVSQHRMHRKRATRSWYRMYGRPGRALPPTKRRLPSCRRRGT